MRTFCFFLAEKEQHLTKENKCAVGKDVYKYETNRIGVSEGTLRDLLRKFKTFLEKIEILSNMTESLFGTIK